MHRNWLVVVALMLVGCFKPRDDSKGRADSGAESGTQDAGSGHGRCGNGVIDTGEQCEIAPLNLNGEVCNSVTLGKLPDGVLGCNEDCSFNITMCVGFGNGGAAAVGGVGGVGGG